MLGICEYDLSIIGVRIVYFLILISKLSIQAQIWEKARFQPLNKAKSLFFVSQICDKIFIHKRAMGFYFLFFVTML